MLTHVRGANSRPVSGARRVTPSRSLPTEVKTPASRSSRLGCKVPYVSTQVVAQLITSRSTRKWKVLDCRFPYEFQGGHISGAMSFPSPLVNQMVQYLVAYASRMGPAGAQAFATTPSRTIVILHCEFSQFRAPRMASELLAELKNRPENALFEVYVMKGGYCDFFRRFPHMCTPQGYVQMHDQSGQVAYPCDYEAFNRLADGLSRGMSRQRQRTVSDASSESETRDSVSQPRDSVSQNRDNVLQNRDSVSQPRVSLGATSTAPSTVAPSLQLKQPSQPGWMEGRALKGKRSIDYSKPAVEYSMRTRESNGNPMSAQWTSTGSSTNQVRSYIASASQPRSSLRHSYGAPGHLAIRKEASPKKTQFGNMNRAALSRPSLGWVSNAENRSNFENRSNSENRSSIGNTSSSAQGSQLSLSAMKDSRAPNCGVRRLRLSSPIVLPSFAHRGRDSSGLGRDSSGLGRDSSGLGRDGSGLGMDSSGLSRESSASNVCLHIPSRSSGSSSPSNRVRVSQESAVSLTDVIERLDDTYASSPRSIAEQCNASDATPAGQPYRGPPESISGRSVEEREGALNSCDSADSVADLADSTVNFTMIEGS